MVSRILIPIDGSPCSERVVAEGLALARDLDASVTFLFVLEDPVVRVYGVPYGRQLHADLQRTGEEALESAAARAQASNVAAKTLFIDDATPIEAILEVEERHDLTVIGTQGHRGVRRMLLGSVADELVRRSGRSHLVVPCQQGSS
jgi:nucleotide-binding universal stress UspA family protein